MITDKILEILSGFECIKNHELDVDFLQNEGISIEPVCDKTVKKYIDGDSLCQFEFKVSFNTDYLKEIVKEVYRFFEKFKSELEAQKQMDMGNKMYLISFVQEGNFEIEHLSGAQMKYAVRCVMNYYKRGE